MRTRQAAHLSLHRLSTVGAGIVCRELINQFGGRKQPGVLLDAGKAWEASECIFAIGQVRPLRPDIVRSFLMKLIEEEVVLRILALAIIAFIEYVEEDDLKFLDERIRREENHPSVATLPNDASPARVMAYLRYVREKAEAKFKHSNRPVVAVRGC
jgi:hypothetical protein